MSTERLSALAVLSTRKEFACSVAFDEFLNFFFLNIIIKFQFFN